MRFEDKNKRFLDLITTAYCLTIFNTLNDSARLRAYHLRRFIRMIPELGEELVRESDEI